MSLLAEKKAEAEAAQLEYERYLNSFEQEYTKILPEEVQAWWLRLAGPTREISTQCLDEDTAAALLLS